MGTISRCQEKRRDGNNFSVAKNGKPERDQLFWGQTGREFREHSRGIFLIRSVRFYAVPSHLHGKYVCDPREKIKTTPKLSAAMPGQIHQEVIIGFGVRHPITTHDGDGKTVSYSPVQYAYGDDKSRPIWKFRDMSSAHHVICKDGLREESKAENN